MKKTVKKLAAVGLTLTTVMGLVACGSPAKEETTSKKDITKPGEFTVMVDGTIVTESAGGEKFYDYLEQLTDLQIKFIRPDHNTYGDAVGIAFNSDDTMPDVVLLSPEYYSLYAAGGFLWNMTDAWANSETKKSGRLIATADNVVATMQVNGADGKKSMYGFAPARGNGCVTYIKEDWITKAGYTKADVESKQFTFAEYYKMLTDMQKATGKTVVSAAGYIGPEAPFTNYLPEFYQQAVYSFYQDASGKYVDGFSTQAMKDALMRIQTAVKDGVIDMESETNTTSICRDKFNADKFGVFTYWAGTWAYNLKTALATNKLNDSLVAIKPIKELGSYLERISPAWCITTGAENPEGIFKYFIDTMLDGGDIQTAWSYGAKGTHWDTKAESVTIKGKEDKPTEYAEGVFHMLPNPEKPTALFTKNHIDPMLALAKFTTADPGIATVKEVAVTNQEFFNNNSVAAKAVPMTDELGEYIGDINTQRKIIVSEVSNGKISADEGMKIYTAKVGGLVTEVLKSLNK